MVVRLPMVRKLLNGCMGIGGKCLHRDKIRNTHSYLSLKLEYLHQEVLLLRAESPHGYTTVGVLRWKASGSTAVVWLKTLLHLHIGITESPR